MAGVKSSPFASPDNAVIIFDWDDTLCPTYWSSTVGSRTWDANVMKQLQAHAVATEMALRSARMFARVAVVTLASPDWFNKSAAKYFPGLDIQALFSQLGVKVFHATVTQSGNMDLEEARIMAKKREMSKCLNGFYSMLRSSRMNVLSIGDSTAEHQALKLLLAESRSAPLCKTLKFSPDPTLEQLTAELKEMVPYLRSMVQTEKDFDRSSGMLWKT